MHDANRVRHFFMACEVQWENQVPSLLRIAVVGTQIAPDCSGGHPACSRSQWWAPSLPQSTRMGAQPAPELSTTSSSSSQTQSSSGLYPSKGDILPDRPPDSPQPPPCPSLPSREGVSEPRGGSVEGRRWEVGGVVRAVAAPAAASGNRDTAEGARRQTGNKALFPGGMRQLQGQFVTKG